MSIKPPFASKRKRSGNILKSLLLSVICLILISDTVVASDTLSSTRLNPGIDEAFDSQPNYTDKERHSKINDDKPKSILAQTILLSQKLHGQSTPHDDIEESFNLTYYTDILNEAASNYIKLKQAKEPTNKGSSEE